MTLRRFSTAAWFVVLFTIIASAGGQQPAQMGDDEFEKMHQMFKPQFGESRWMEIDWYPSVWEARRLAAAEGKPLFLWAGSGGAPAAGC
jgi:hypothetical protein